MFDGDLNTPFLEHLREVVPDKTQKTFVTV